MSTETTKIQGPQGNHRDLENGRGRSFVRLPFHAASIIGKDGRAAPRTRTALGLSTYGPPVQPHSSVYWLFFFYLLPFSLHLHLSQPSSSSSFSSASSSASSSNSSCSRRRCLAFVLLLCTGTVRGRRKQPPFCFI